MAGIAAVDSLNPGTIGPALVLAVSDRPVDRVLQFGLGMMLVNVLGGILLVAGPGKLLFDLIPHIGTHLKHVLEVVGGLALLAGAATLLVLRRRLVEREKAEEEDKAAGRVGAGSAFFAGAGIAAAELPTAFPYFAAIAAIDAASISLPGEIVLVVLFNAIFLAPVFLIALVMKLFPEKRDSVIEPVRRWMSQHWPQVLAGLLAVAGVVVLVLGIAGLSGD